jgi:hypothetical protein
VYCTPDETMCHGSCSALYKDPFNCGGCDVACAQGLVCSKGACATSCGGGTAQCGQSCVELALDRENCGSCENACSPGQVCTAGKCASSCPVSQRLCGGSAAPYCATTASDNKNCGDCGVECGQGLKCANGACGVACVGSQALCGVECTDLKTDPSHCGNCGNACTFNEICVGGACACPSMQSNCGGACVDLTTDKNNCGACGQDCSAGTCKAGRCAVVVATTASAGESIALDVARVYWNESSGALNQVLKTGQALDTLSTDVTTPSIALDGTYVYWSNGTDIDFITIGGGTTNIEPLSLYATEIVADSSAVYVAHSDGIVRFPAGGGTATAIVASEPSPRSLAVQGTTLFWANGAYELRSANVDGTNLATLTTMTSAIGPVASDGTSVYFAWSSDLVMLPVSTSGPPLLLANGLINVTRIVTDGAYVYWLDGQTISKVPCGGGPKTVLYTTSGNAADLAVDASSIYWTSSSAVMKLTPK